MKVETKAERRTGRENTGIGQEPVPPKPRENHMKKRKKKQIPTRNTQKSHVSGGEVDKCWLTGADEDATQLNNSPV